MNIDKQNNLKAFLEIKGFNLFGSCRIETYNQSVEARFRIPGSFPPAGSIIIFGSGGKYFWDVFKKFRQSKAGNFLKETEDPVDTYTEFIVEGLLAKFPEISGFFYPFKEAGFLIDYQKLAVCTGLGHYSPYIKLVLHPEFGSWVSLRGAFLTGLALPPTGPLLTPVPCNDCPKPCLQACPVQAVTEKNFDFTVCFAHRNSETDCLSHCHVRKACIIGPEHAYSNEEGLHRNKASLKSLRKYFN